MRRNRRKRACGFTLLELLVAISILTLVIGAIAASFAAGVRVWSAAMEVSRTEEATRAELGVWHRDLMNARRFSGLPFEGESRALTFPVVQDFADATGGVGPGEQLGAVRYWHDTREQALFRQASPFPVPAEWPRDGAERWIARVASATFEYLEFPDADAESGGTAAWMTEWNQPTNMPLGVRIRLRLLDAEPGTALTRTVILPWRQWRPESGD